ncbi:unnamed protein product [Rotaria sp. Silwood2]|nr:unnamed protein product [Rotaria sp. Silwood2]
MTSNNNNSAISQFFNAKSVFMTGATGFIGKQIIEKLLRSCPGIDNIYILIRSKRGAHVHERVQQLCSLALFDRVRLLTPNFKSKIIPIIGDITKANFDLTNEDEKTLIENCHIVINSGASIRFNEPLKQSIKANVYSVQSMINLCKKMKHLQSFVHISTAYVHCYRADINEVIYPMDDDLDILLESLDYFDDQVFNHLSERLAKKYPNTYSYTKSLAECLLLQQGNDLPIAIIRPSIVGAAWKEPVTGWIDSYAGSTSIIAAIGKCLIRVASSNEIVDFPIIPVDAVANMTIAITWITATKNNSLSTPSIYNCCTGTNTKTCLPYGDICNFDLTELNWPSYIRNYCIGIKKYLLKEDLQQSSIKKSHKYSFIKAKKIRHLLSLFFFFAVTWLMRQTFLRRLRIIWRTLNTIIRSYLQQDKKIICSLK